MVQKTGQKQLNDMGKDVRQGTQSKKVPNKTITLRYGVNTMVLQKLVLLNNHCVQYFNVKYEEVFIKGIEIHIVYFEPSIISLSSYENLKQINDLIVECLNADTISKDAMVKANELWKVLKEEAKKKSAS